MMPKSEVLRKFTSMETSSKYLTERFGELQKKFGDKFIAIKDGKVIANADNFQGITEEVKPERVSQESIIVQFIPAEGEIILY